ncbi:hypothetical protein GMA10_01485 [Kocuria koreensis]|jgi:hypothetical protein|uniref:Uncharacterized protein n=1 Tax=Rothia koreensis TaxID=592378 RepID=A0A7K1LFF6_9MICC|nr:hypothetical protein [Rothia koreensis]MUN53911.1 hypothetical protein [Rothia koreensis]
MLLMTTDVMRRRDEARLNTLLEANDAAVVEALGVPDTVRYWFLTGDLSGDALQEQAVEVLP